MSKNDYMQSLLADGKTPQNAADKIPIIASGAVSDRARETLNRASIQSLCPDRHIQLTAFCCRSNDSSKKNASQQTRSSTLR